MTFQDHSSDTTQIADAQKPLTRRQALKWGATLGSSALAIPTILSACGGTNSLTSSSTPAATKSLRVYWNAGHNYTTYQKVISQFEKDHPGWKVNLQLFQWPDLRTKLLANFASHDVPDLVEHPGSWALEFGKAGQLASLQSYIDKDKQTTGFPDDWQGYTVDRSTVNGEVFGVQFHLTCMLCLYNKDLFSKAGISTFPTNWEDFLAAAKTLTSNNVYGFAMNQNSSYAWPWFYQNKVRLYDADKKVLTMDNDSAYEALQFQADLVYKHKVSPVPLNTGSYDGPQKLFSAGRAAMIITGPWDIKPILTGSPNLNWGIAGALKHQVQATAAAGSGLAIPKEAKNPEMAWELIKRLTALDTEIAATKEARMTMPRKSWAENDEVKKLDLIAPFGQGLSYATYDSDLLRTTDKSAAITSLYDQAFQSVIYKQSPVVQTLKEFVVAGNKALGQ